MEIEKKIKVPTPYLVPIPMNNTNNMHINNSTSMINSMGNQIYKNLNKYENISSIIFYQYMIYIFISFYMGRSVANVVSKG